MKIPVFWNGAEQSMNLKNTRDSFKFGMTYECDDNKWKAITVSTDHGFSILLWNNPYLLYFYFIILLIQSEMWYLIKKDTDIIICKCY